MLSVEEMVAIPRLEEIATSPDGTWVAASVARLSEDGSKYIRDLWCIPADGAEPRQLTSGPWNDTKPRFRHDGHLGFLSNRPIGKSSEPGEDKRTQVWLLPPWGEARRLTDEPLGVSDFRFARSADVLVVKASRWPDVDNDKQRAHAQELSEKGPSGKRFTTMPIRFWDDWVEAARPHFIAYRGEPVDLTPDAGAEYRFGSWDLSPDGSFLVTTATHLDTDRIESAVLRKIRLDHPKSYIDMGRPHGRYGTPRISGNGKRVAAIRETRHLDKCEELELVCFDLGSQAETRLAASWDRWAMPDAWDGDALLCTAADRGYQPVVRVDDEVQVVSTEPATYAQAQPCGASLVALRSSFTQPPHIVELGSGNALGAPTSLPGDVRIEELETKATDGESIKSFLLTPPSEGPFPTVVWIHGGPISQWSHGWHWRWNPLVMVHAGYAVALPNPRGSTGQGWDFIAGVWGNEWGGQCFDDLMKVVDDLEKHEAVDEARIGAMGGSFGGFMANWIGTQTDRFKALVSHAGVYDMRAFYGATDHPAGFGAMLNATPWSGEIDKYSPHSAIAKWRTPTLVVHGERDFRVPIGEALALFEALQAHGVPSELLVFPDENHWIAKPRNVVMWYRTILEFLGRHLIDP